MHYKLQDIPQDFSRVKNIFFVGIKGVGMTPLAIIAKQAGFNIAGSDISEEFITDNSLNYEEIIIFEEFDEKDIELFFEGFEKDENLVVTTGAHKGFDNPQSNWARNKGITVLTQGQALGIFMEGEIFDRSFKSIAVAASHGKTTISALLASALVSLSQDPTYTVGTGELFPVGSPGHYGVGEYFIAEADEYASEPVYDKVPKFLYQNPEFAIFNNIDFDHPDLFKDIEEVKKAFFEFAHNIKSNGILFTNGDDKYLQELKKEINKDIRIITYGKLVSNDYVITKFVNEGFESRFTVLKHGKEIGVFELGLPGIHNAHNSLSVIALLLEFGFEASEIRHSLKTFKGTKRRMEIIGKTNEGALIIDDYAHHPLEISTTLDAIKNAVFDKKIVAIFQPHTTSRTKALLSEFAESFSEVEKLILLPVFKSQRDTEKDNLSKDEYVSSFKVQNDVILIENFSDVVKYVRENYASGGFVFVTIGAGDVYKIAYELTKE